MQIAAGERTVVGINRGISEDPRDQDVRVHEVLPELVAGHIERLTRFKASRDQAAVATALDALRVAAEARDVNLMPPAMAAVEAGATLGEINGYVRLGFGYPYDDLDAVQAPFEAGATQNQA